MTAIARLKCSSRNITIAPDTTATPCQPYWFQANTSNKRPAAGTRYLRKFIDGLSLVAKPRYCEARVSILCREAMPEGTSRRHISFTGMCPGHPEVYESRLLFPHCSLVHCHGGAAAT